MLLMQTAAAARDDKDTFLQACVTQLEVQMADALVTLQEESNKQNAFEAQSTKDTRLMREGAAAEALVMVLRFAEAKLKQQEAEKRAQAMEDKLTKALARIRVRRLRRERAGRRVDSNTGRAGRRVDSNTGEHRSAHLSTGECCMEPVRNPCNWGWRRQDSVHWPHPSGSRKSFGIKKKILRDQEK